MSSDAVQVLLASMLIIVGILTLYIWHNDKKLTALPFECIAASPHRWTDADIRREQTRMQAAPVDVTGALPQRTGRRYLVVGGAGFLGGWLVVHLLARGEHPRRIRVLDIRKPTRADLTTGAAKEVDFRICDIADEEAVRRAFEASWPVVDDNGKHHEGEGGSEGTIPELTVFQTAASIRFYERAWSLVPFSAAVNVRGVENVLNAARGAGATILVATSSGSTCVRRARFWLWPWETAPPFFVQRINDDDEDQNPTIPRKHAQFFSNYAYTKRLGEELIRRADGSALACGRTLRTGTLRPGNGIYGPGGDVLCGAALVRGVNPTWIANTMQNFVYVENASLAHLCYEARLLPGQAKADDAPDIGGQAFCIADAGPPPTYGDVYRALHVLSAGRATFPSLSPTLALLIATLVEPIHVIRLTLSLSSSTFLRYLSSFVPRLPGDQLNLQPSLFALVSVHMLFDDSRARGPPSAGGLGYAPRWTTLQGLCALVDAFEKGGRVAEARQHAGGVSAGWGLQGLQIMKLPHALGGLWRPGPKEAGTPRPEEIPKPAAQDGGIEVEVSDAGGRADGLRKRAR